MDIVDFHSHILPHADHGSSSTSVSLTQLQLAKESGVERIILTPHYYPHMENSDSFLNRREKCYAHLLKSLTAEYPEVRLGAEVLICDNIEEMPLIEHLCIRGTKVLLLELPFSDFSPSYAVSVKCLILKGYTVILAHADRYDPDHIDLLVSAGAKVQLNADALSGLSIGKHIKRWLRDDVVYAIGSDIHGEDKKAYRTFKKAIKKLQSYSVAVKSHSDYIWNTAKK